MKHHITVNWYNKILDIVCTLLAAGGRAYSKEELEASGVTHGSEKTICVKSRPWFIDQNLKLKNISNPPTRRKEKKINLF